MELRVDHQLGNKKVVIIAAPVTDRGCGNYDTSESSDCEDLTVFAVGDRDVVLVSKVGLFEKFGGGQGSPDLGLGLLGVTPDRVPE